MLPNPQIPVYLVAFSEEILDGKLHFLFSENNLAPTESAQTHYRNVRTILCKLL